MQNPVRFSLSLTAILVAGCAHHDRAAESRATSANDQKDPPFTADTHFAAGQLAETQQNLPAALAHYHAALKLQHDHTPSLYRLGILQTRLKNYTEALDAWQSYVRATKGSATAYSNLGFCYDLANNFEESRRAYEKGLARDPNNTACRVNYGLMLARHDHTPEALAQLRRALPEPQVHYNLASIYESTHQLDNARAEYTRALDLDPSFTDARIRLARLNARAHAAATQPAP